MILLGHLFGGLCTHLTVFETSLFEKISPLLSREDRDILSAQLDDINYIRRIVDDKQILFYRVRNLRVTPERKAKFRYSGEHRLLKCEVSFGSAAIRLEVWLVEGNLFSLEFNDGVQQFRDRSDFSVSKVS